MKNKTNKKKLCNKPIQHLILEKVLTRERKKRDVQNRNIKFLNTK